MPRKRTQILTVDGEPFRWRASRRAIMVEHAETPRGRVREFLTLQEHVEPARIVHLVRHARTRGWRPTEDDDVFEIEAISVWDDPRSRDHYQWMRLMREQLHSLEKFLGCPVEVGSYWWHGSYDSEMGGLGARLRFGPCDLYPNGEFWEAAYCVTGTEGVRAYSDIFAFPFRGGENLGLADAQSWVLWLKQDCEHSEGVWRSHGWQPWDPPNQWSYASEPGQIFSTLVPGKTEISVKRGQPIPVHLSLEHAGHKAERTTMALHSVIEESRGPLVQMGRGDNQWFPWHEIEVAEIDRTEASVLIDADVSRLAVSGGWETGRYQVALRVRSVQAREEQGLSDITAPMTIEIS